jgi:hypothetical protein
LVIVLAALAVMFLSTDSAYCDIWYNCMHIDITNPDEGDNFETHDWVQVRWTAYYTGDMPGPNDDLWYRIVCWTTPYQTCQIYQAMDTYHSSQITDYGVYYPYDWKAEGSHDWLVPGYMTARFPNAQLVVYSARTPNGPWYEEDINIRIKLIYDPLPDPREDPPFQGSSGADPACSYLSEPFPNPFNPQTSIQFGLEEATNVSLKIYDVNGRLVKTLHNNSNLPAGKYQEDWKGLNNDGTSVPSGIYFLKLMTGSGYSKTQKMILLQ